MEWPSRFAQVLTETLAGSRPPAQIAPWTTERARTHIRKLGPLLMAGPRPVVRRVVTSRPAPGVVEMSIVVGTADRIRALAIRLEHQGARRAAPGRPGRQARWVCTTVEAA
ncbi:MAG TPA: Rv3235 family protein [Streptosporangiaceae bacterium]